MKKQKGFTLVELIVIVTILVVMGSVVALRMGDSQVFKKESSLTQLKFFLKSTQKIAIQNRREVFILKNDDVFMACYILENPCSTSNSVSIAGKELKINNLSEVPFVSNFKFLSDGTANQNLNISIGDKQIKITGSTGYVE